MTRLYISGPMSGLPDFNFPAFRVAATKLREAGYEVEDPAEKGVIDGWEWIDYLRYDLHRLIDCDGVAVLYGWPNSRGARLEVNTAEGLGLPVYGVEAWLRLAAGDEVA